MKFTTLPFLFAFMAGLLAMPGLNIYDIHARNHGTEETEPWRATPSERPLVARVIAVGSRVRAWLAELTDVPLVASEVGAVGSIKQLIQDEADTKKAILALKKEGRALAALTGRTPEQQATDTTRYNAIFAELDGLDEKLEANTVALAHARRLQDTERGSTSVIEVGADHASEKAWGPTLHRDATPRMKAEAQLAALGEFAIAVKNVATGQGADPRLFAAATGMGTAVPSDGGFAVPLEVAAGIEYTMFATGDLLSRVDARTITGDAIAYNVINETSRADGSRQGGVLAYWVDQGTAPTPSQTKLARVEMKLRKVAALGYMTDELVSDAAALGGELQSMFSEELIFQTEDAIYEGSGAGQPLGYTNANCPCLVSVAKESGQTAATINTANLSKMWARLPARSKKTSVWLINVDCEPQLDFLTIPAGLDALEPRFVNYGPDGILLIKGRPVVQIEYAATIGTVGDISLVDLSKYRLIRKSGGVEQASSMHVLFTSDQMAFRAIYRVDGQPMPRAPITPYRGTATLSPFVVLATRS